MKIIIPILCLFVLNSVHAQGGGTPPSYVITTTFKGVVTQNNVDSGTNFRFVYSISDSFKIDSVKINDTLNNSAKDSLNGFTFDTVKSNITFEIFLSLKKFHVLAIRFNTTSSMADTTHHIVHYDSTLQVGINLPTGHKIDSVYVNGTRKYTGFGFVSNYTFNNVRGDSTITYFVSPLQFHIFVVRLNTLSNIADTTDHIVNYNETRQVGINLPTGHKIDSVYINGSRKFTGFGFGSNYNFNNVTGDSLIKYFISPIQLHVLNIKFNNFTQTADTQHNFINYGTDFYAQSNIPSGYTIDSVFVNGKRKFTGIGLDGNYNFVNVTGDSSITYYINRISLTITTTVLERMDTFDIAYGNNYRVEYTIPEFYKIDSIKINGENLTPTPTDSLTGYTLTSIDENIDFELYTSLIELHVLNITYNNYSQSADTMHNFVTYGEDFYAEPNIPTGYKIDSVLVNNKRQLTGIGLGSNYNFDSVRGDSVIVYFVSRKLITITTEIINLNDTFEIAYGDNYRVEYTIPEFYKIDSIKINGENLTPTPTDSLTGYTLTSIDENIDFELYTSLIELHVLNITYNNYSQSADTMHNFVTYGEDFYAEPNIPTGYKIDSVLVNNKRQLTGIGLGSNYNFDSVRGDSVIVYYVSRKLITITTEIINLTDTLDIAYGDSFRFTYSIPQYYKIDSIVINSQKLNPTPVDSTTGYTIKNIIDNIDFKLYVSKISLIVTTSTMDRNDTFSVAFGDKLVINTIKMGYKLDSIYLNTLKVPNGQDSLRTFTLVNIMTNYNVKLYYSYIFSNKNYDIVNTSNVCINTSNGAVNVSVLDTNLVYTAILTGISVTFKDTNIINKTKSTQYTNLQSGTYRLVLSVTDPTNVIHKDSFVITIGQPQPLTAYSEINNLNKHVLLNLNGAETYYIKLNGVVMSTQNTSLNLPLEKGVNVLSISSNLTCQDEIKQTILISEDMMVYPNPANQYINLYIAGSDEVTDIQIIDEAGKVFKNSTENIPSNRILNFDISQYHQGIYLITIKGKSAFGQLKFVKTK